MANQFSNPGELDKFGLGMISQADCYGLRPFMSLANNSVLVGHLLKGDELGHVLAMNLMLESIDSLTMLGTVGH